MLSKKAIRIIALVLALLMFGSVAFVLIRTVASGVYIEDAAAAAAAATIHIPGDSFSIVIVVIFLAALAALITMGIYYLIRKRKK